MQAEIELLQVNSLNFELLFYTDDIFQKRFHHIKKLLPRLLQFPLFSII